MAESSGSAEVGVLALGSFLVFMGGKSHSEHCFFPLSIKHLNTSKQGKTRKMGTSTSMVFLHGAGRCRRCGAAGAMEKPHCVGDGQLCLEGGLEGDRDKAWILVTRLIKELF